MTNKQQTKGERLDELFKLLDEHKEANKDLYTTVYAALQNDEEIPRETFRRFEEAVAESRELAAKAAAVVKEAN